MVGLEATGVYYLGLAIAAIEGGLGVRVLNPWQVRTFAVSRLARTKTDRVDAVLIREFTERMFDDLNAWYPPPEGLLRVTALVRLGDGLVRHRVAAGNRVHALRHVDSVVAEVADLVADELRGQRKAVMAAALAAGQADELVSVWLERLMTLPGFGEVSALRFLAYAGDVRRFPTARKFAAYTGLSPKFSQSGDGVTVGRISRIGPATLRAVLYWAAMSASRTDTAQGRLYRRLVDAGKPKKVALVAVANRLARGGWRVCVGSSPVSG